MQNLDVCFMIHPLSVVAVVVFPLHGIGEAKDFHQEGPQCPAYLTALSPSKDRPPSVRWGGGGAGSREDLSGISFLARLSLSTRLGENGGGGRVVKEIGKAGWSPSSAGLAVTEARQWYGRKGSRGGRGIISL